MTRRVGQGFNDAVGALRFTQGAEDGIRDGRLGSAVAGFGEQVEQRCVRVDLLD